MSFVMDARSWEGFQPHSFRAAESSIDSGHESAMACRESGSYRTVKPATRFAISAASSPAEAHRRDVEIAVMTEPLEVGLHEIDRRLQAVGHVHHRKPRVFPEEARVRPFLDRLVEDVDGVVRRASAGQRLGRDDAGIAGPLASTPNLLT